MRTSAGEESRRTDPEWAADLLQRYPVRRSAMLMLLWRVQERDGFISDEARDEVAALCEVPPAEVESVVTFYTMFRRRRPPERRLQVCRSMCCAAFGADELIAELHRDHPEVEVVECLAACDRAPCGLFNERLVGPLDRRKAEELLGGRPA